MLIAITLLVLWIGKEATYSFITSRLAHDAEAIIAGLDLDRKELRSDLPPIYSQPFSGHYYLIRFSDGQTLRSRSLWDSDLQIQPLKPGNELTVMIDGPRQQRLLLWSAAYTKQGMTFTVSVAEDISNLFSTLQRILWFGLAIAALSAIALLLTQKKILRRAFKQMDAMREDIRNIREGKTDELRQQAPAEIQPLVSEFNQLLNTWRNHLERSRTASGNLAHALKSPLNLIYQIGLEKNDQQINEQVTRMREIIDRELNRARIAGTVSAGRRFHPAKDIADLVDTILLLYRDKHLDITTHLSAPEQLPLEQDDMQELIGNLLDNAAKWAKSRIVMSLEAQDTLTLIIQDDGPGIDPALSVDLLKRGKRLDEKTPGHGLGLSIVQDIIDQYQGTIQLAPSSFLGGTCVTVELPFSE